MEETASRRAFLGSIDYAHRGLHGGGSAPPENSLPAFAAAIDRGFGVECDVRLSRDGIAYVFHDERLDRMTDAHGRLTDRLAQELDALRLVRRGGAIPRLSALLALMGGRAPLLIEVKTGRGEATAPVCRAVLGDLRVYRGPVAIMSFHPGVARWFWRHARDVVRGLVITEARRRDAWSRWRRRLALRASRADFLAYDIRDLPSPLAGRARERGLPVLTWTVRDEAQWLTAHDYADAAIFEPRQMGTADG